ncbi:MAG: SEC-C domain-containing protein [Acidimicrobiales bacterium]
MDDGNDANQTAGRHDGPETTGAGATGADTSDAVAAALEALLLERGPLPIEELAAALADTHPELAAGLAGDPAAPAAAGAAEALVARVTAVAQQSDAFWRLPDERIAPVLHHLRRATFTHRLTASEHRRGAIDLEPDIVALAIGRTATGPDGIALRTAGADDDPRADEHGSLLGPDGWLDAHPVGTLLAVRYDGEHVTIEAVDEARLDPGQADAVTAALRDTYALLPTARAPEVHRLVVDTMGLHPSCFATPVAPLRELLADAGLRRRGPWVGPVSRAWSTPAEQARRNRLEEVLTGADACCQQAARHALDAWHAWLERLEGGDDTEPAGEERTAEQSTGEPTGGSVDGRLVDDIDHGGIAAALAEVATMGRPLISVRRLGRWAGEVAAAAPHDAAALHYLQALGADAEADPQRAEAELRAGLAVDADHPACLGFLAELTQDRGDAQGSLSLLQRTGRPVTAEALAELAPFTVPRNVGRNEPCPCGSGRKFKACCARGPVTRPLVVRMRWLRTRAMRHAVRNDPLTVNSLRHVFDVSNGGADAFANVLDMLLFASNGLRRYLDARGALLPADELECARSWLDQPMRLLVVDHAGTDGVVEATDARGGTALTIDDPAAAATAEAGGLVLARPLPVQGAWILSGTMIHVPANGRDAALELLEEHDGHLRPFHLLHLMVDFQVAALRGI